MRIRNFILSVCAGLAGASLLQIAYAGVVIDGTPPITGSSTVVADAPLAGNGSSGSHLSIPAAGAASDGYVTTGTQTFAGAKTFTGNVTTGNVLSNGTFTATGGALSGITTIAASGNIHTTGGYVLADRADFSLVSVQGAGVALDANANVYLKESLSNNRATLVGSGLDITAGGDRPVRQTLDTCAAGLEGAIETDVLSGAATGKRTKVCLCTSDGSSAYKWQNIATATLGTTTACGTE